MDGDGFVGAVLLSDGAHHNNGAFRCNQASFDVALAKTMRASAFAINQGMRSFSWATSVASDPSAGRKRRHVWAVEECSDGIEHVGIGARSPRLWMTVIVLTGGRETTGHAGRSWVADGRSRRPACSGRRWLPATDAKTDA